MALFIASQRRAEKAKDAALRKQRVFIRELLAEVIALHKERGFRAARVPLGDTYGTSAGAFAALGINVNLARSDYEIGKPTEREWTYTPGHEPDEIPPVGAAQ